jgi:hypothetical protein
MEAFTYLLGAGASYFSVPITKSIPGTMRQYLNHVDHLIKGSRLSSVSPSEVSHFESELSTLKKTIGDVLSEVEKHNGDFDLAAKICFDKGDSDTLLKIKLVGTMYLQFMQHPQCTYKVDVEKKVESVDLDSRYYRFVEEITDSKGRILPNITVLSWNYDWQLEQAWCSLYAESGSLSDFESARQALKIYHVGAGELGDSDFQVFKLNGTAVFSRGTPDGKVSIDHGCFTAESLDELILYQARLLPKALDSDIQTFLTFGFERTYATAEQSLVKAIQGRCQLTSHLICIGYQFHKANSPLDRIAFQWSRGLKFIIVQNPDESRVLQVIDDYLGLKIFAPTGKQPNYTLSRHQYADLMPTIRSCSPGLFFVSPIVES